MSGLTSEQSAIIRFEISYDNFNCFRVNKDLKSNRIFMLAAVTKSCHALKYASSELKKDPEVVLAAIRKNWQAIQYVSEDPNGFINDESFMQLAVKVDARSLQYASDLLRDNSEFMLSALSNAVQKDRLYGSLAFMYASDALKVNQNFILNAVGITIHVLEYVSREFRTNRPFILAAVKKNGNSLRYTLDDAFTADREIVLAAVTTAPSILLIASDSLRQDPEIVMAAMEKNEQSLQYARQLSGNRDFMLEVVKKNWRALQYASPVLKEDREIVEAAVRRTGLPWSPLARDWHALQFASKSLRDDRDFMLDIIVNVNCGALQYASHELKCNHQFIAWLLLETSMDTDDMKVFGAESGSITNNQVREVWALKEALVAENEAAEEETASRFSKIEDISKIYRSFPLHYITYDSLEGMTRSEEKDALLQYRFELLKSADEKPLVVLAIQNLNLGEGVKDSHVMGCSSMDKVKALVKVQFSRLTVELMLAEKKDFYLDRYVSKADLLEKIDLDISKYDSYDQFKEVIQSTIENAVGRSTPSCGL